MLAAVLTAALAHQRPWRCHRFFHCIRIAAETAAVTAAVSRVEPALLGALTHLAALALQPAHALLSPLQWQHTVSNWILFARS